MKIDIIIDDHPKVVNIKGLKGKHRTSFMKKLAEMSKLGKGEIDEDAATKGVEDFNKFQDDMAREVVDLPEGEYDNLDLEEQNKIIAAIRKIILPYGESKSLF